MDAQPNVDHEDRASHSERFNVAFRNFTRSDGSLINAPYHTNKCCASFESRVMFLSQEAYSTKLV